MTYSHIPNRLPAWTGTAPDLDCGFRHAVPEDVAIWLSDMLSSSFFDAGIAVEGRLAPAPGRFGHFLVRAAGVHSVVHVKPASVAGDLELAADIADWLAGGGVPVAAYRRTGDGLAEFDRGDAFVTVTRFWPGRHHEHTRADAAAIGRGLARLHTRLSGFPGVAEVARRTGQTMSALAATRQQVLEGRARAIPDQWAGQVLRAAELYRPETAWAGPVQCGHGDLSPGNVLIGDDGEAVFCDFEDSAFGYRPVAFDIAMAVLRFGLEGGEGADGSDPAGRSGALLDACAEAGGALIGRADIVRAIEGLSHHFTLVMAHLAINGTVPDDPEWQKARGWPALAEALAS